MFKTADKPKHPGGAPTKYKPEYCDLIIKHLAGGLSMESFAGVVDVSRDTIYEWRDKHQEFSDSISIGISKSLLFWERLGLGGTTGKIKGFNPATYIFTMKNKFKWRDRVEHSADDESPIVLGYDPKDI